jgi:hypothetical protein
MSEVDQRASHEQFMNATGFNKGNSVATLSDVYKSNKSPHPPPMFKKKQSGLPSDMTALQRIHADAAPTHEALSNVPNRMQPNRGQDGALTPNNGIVSGHLPLDQRTMANAKAPKDVYPESNLLGRDPFVAENAPRKQDWSAVGVGHDTGFKAPGQVGISPADQGRLPSPYKGSGGSKKRRKKKEKNVGERIKTWWSEARTRQNFGIVLVVSTMLGVVILTFVLKVALTYALGVAAVAAVGAGAYLIATGRQDVLADAGDNILGQKARVARSARRRDNGDLGESTFGYGGGGAREFQVADSSREQVMFPYGADDEDANPYPNNLYSQAGLGLSLAAAGVDPDAEEGPRGDYDYYRPPEPLPNAKESDLMRSAKNHNMDERGLREYMDSLNGHAYNQFYQRTPYMATAPFWDHHQQISDAQNIHGISGQPGTFTRKFAPRRPKQDQAGALTMHLKPPPPGTTTGVDRVHPWQQAPDYYTQQGGLPMGSTPMNAPPPQENQQAFRPPMEGGYNFSQQQQDLFDQKVGMADADRLADMRDRENAMIRQRQGMANGMAPSGQRELPPHMQPIETRPKQRPQPQLPPNMLPINVNPNRVGSAPPHSHPPAPPQPLGYPNRPNQPPPANARGVLSEDERAMNEFESAFTKPAAASEQMIEQALANPGRRD